MTLKLRYILYLKLLDGPPKKVLTGRHCQAHPDIWSAIEAEMDL
jgi:hypothetical protein